MKTLIAQYPSDVFFLDFFARKNFLDYFMYKNVKIRRRDALAYCEGKKNAQLSCCSFFPAMEYRIASAFAPLPYRWFIKNQADATHFFNFIVPPFARGKKVVTIHDMAFKRFPQTVRFRTKCLLNLNLHKAVKRADRIVAVSEFTKNEILAFYPYSAEKIKVVYNGVNTQKYNAAIAPAEIAPARKRYGVPEDYILYVGTLEPRKNIERLIRAYDQVKKRYADFPVLVLAGGKGWLCENIFQTVKDLRLEKDIVFTGYVDDRAKPCLMAGARCFCFPSLYEGFGMPVLEAMACGTPTLTSRNSALTEVAGDAALLADAFSVESIADALEKLCFDETLRAELRQKGLERAERFSWRKAAELLHTIYKEVIFE
jgi:glycosyltransferase involved in cell wall biosynthesis